MCVKNDKDNLKFEDAIFALKQAWAKKIILFYLFIYLVSIAFSNFSGLVIAKNASSTLRSIIDTMRTIIIWIFFLIMPFVPQGTKESFSFIQLFGFVVLVLGGLIYHEILIIPFYKFDENTKKARKKREFYFTNYRDQTQRKR